MKEASAIQADAFFLTYFNEYKRIIYQGNHGGVKMSIGTAFMFALVIFSLIVSVRERIKIRHYRDWDILGESKVSPLSQAIANLIGVAGGIYLALVVLIAFLEIPIPSRVSVLWLSVEPLAAVAVLLAIIQPFMLRLLVVYRSLK